MKTNDLIFYTQWIIYYEITAVKYTVNPYLLLNLSVENLQLILNFLYGRHLKMYSQWCMLPNVHYSFLTVQFTVQFYKKYFFKNLLS